MGARIDKTIEILHSRKGKNAITFLVFIVLSAILWVVQSLNEEIQQDIRCTVKITNVPDSVTRITPIPEAINVSVKARGTQLLKYWWSHTPQISLDYRTYKKTDKIQFGENGMKAFFRNVVGQGSEVLSVTPDSLSITFTSLPGIPLPVKQHVKVETAPQFALVGQPQLLTDSVMLYSVNNSIRNLKSISTQTLVFTDVRKSQVVKVALDLPAGSRAIPDSVEVKFQVEPLISKMRKVAVHPVNVPANMRLVTVPSQVEVYYMVPMSLYKKSDSDPHFKIEADYNDIRNTHSERIPVELTDVPRDFTNVYMSVDSVDYILEQR